MATKDGKGKGPDNIEDLLRKKLSAVHFLAKDLGDGHLTYYAKDGKIKFQVPVEQVGDTHTWGATLPPEHVTVELWKHEIAGLSAKQVLTRVYRKLEEEIK